MTHKVIEMAGTTDDTGVGYTPLRKNPLNEDRSSTHIAFIFIFGLIVIAVGVSYCVICSNSIKDIYDHEFTGNDMKNDSVWFSAYASITLRNSEAYSVSQYFQYHRHVDPVPICVIAILGGVLMLLFLLIIRWIPRFCTWLAIINLICLIPSTCFLIHKEFTGPRKDLSFEDVNAMIFNTTLNIMKIIFIFTILIFCIKQAGVNVIANIIRKSIRAMFFYPSLILLGLSVFALNILIALFIHSACRYLNPCRPLLYVIVFGSVYVYRCIYYFGKMVTAQAIAIWHCSENKQDIARTTVLRSIFIVCRYHLGAVFFAATAILPLIAAIVVLCKHKFRAAQKSGNVFVEVLCKVFLIWHIADYALIITSVHGHDFCQATKRTYQLMTKKCSLSLSTIYIFYINLLTGIPIIFALGAICMEIFQLISTDKLVMPGIYNGNDIDVNQSIRFFVSLLVSVILIAETSLHTTLLCTIEDDDDNDLLEKRSFRLPLNDVKQVS